MNIFRGHEISDGGAAGTSSNEGTFFLRSNRFSKGLRLSRHIPGSVRSQTVAIDRHKHSTYVLRTNNLWPIRKDKQIHRSLGQRHFLSLLDNFARSNLSGSFSWTIMCLPSSYLLNIHFAMAAKLYLWPFCNQYYPLDERDSTPYCFESARETFCDRSPKTSPKYHEHMWTGSTM